MKTLILTRHAKSDWSVLLQTDYDRELNSRGLQDAPMMGKRLQQRELNIYLVVASTARRAEQTALFIAEELNYNKKRIQWVEQLYHASADKILEVLFEITNEANNVLLVGHNNGISQLATILLNKMDMDMPTCAMVAIAVETDDWSQLPLAKKTLLFYDFPKNQVY